MIKVSVIIPVYNAENYLAKCLDSVVNQNLDEIEIICIDDGSTDSSKEIIQTYVDRFSNFKFLCQKNMGSGIARNKGIENAEGEYIAFMDADDYYPSEKALTDLFNAAISNQALICGGGISLEKNGKYFHGNERGANNYYSEEGFLEYKDIQCDYGYQRYIFSKKLLMDNNIIFPDYLRFQDPPFLVKAMMAAGKFYCIKEDTYCYRQGHQTINWTSRKVNDLICGIYDVWKLAEKNDLTKLNTVSISRINKEYNSIIKNSIIDGNQEAIRNLIKFNGAILLTSNNQTIFAPILELLNEKEDVKIERQARIELEKKLQEIQSSETYLIGKIVLYLPKKIKNLIRIFTK